MIGPDRLDRVGAEAVVPEQVVSYVRTVAGSRPRLFGECVGYASHADIVLIGYPRHDPRDIAALSRAVDEVLKTTGLQKITVIGPARPTQAPDNSRSRRDDYHVLPVPIPPPPAKLRNLLRRADRELSIEHGRLFKNEHQALVDRYLSQRTLEAGTRHIFRQISGYIEASPSSLIVSARTAEGRLAAFAVGEYVSLHTAFFMFCFRDSSLAPPGSADRVLFGLLQEAAERGQTRMNLGLSVNEGIRFFKRKWGAQLFLPCIETEWEIKPAGVFPGRTNSKSIEIMNPNKLASAAQTFRGPGFWETLRETFLGVRRPFSCLQVEVTSRCPGRCIYCPRTVWQGQWSGRDMDADTFTRLWPLMRRTARVHLQGWGEPLLNPLFFDMVALACKAGCNVSTTTGGLLMTPDLARRIVGSGMDIVAFSLAGTDPAGNAPRQGMDFDKVCAAITTLQTERKKRMGVHLELHIAYLLLASNLNSVRELPELMKQLGVHAAVVSTLDYLPGAQLAGEAFAPHDTEKLARAAAVLEETAIRARELDLGFEFALPVANAAGNNCRENIQHSLFVSADGSVSPCVYLNVPMSCPDTNRRIFGNVREQDPKEIWESDAFGSFRESLSRGNPDLPCRSCPKRMMP